MRVQLDRYNGITVDQSTLPETIEQFESELLEIICSAIDKKLLWINIPIDKTEFIPSLTKNGFQFHHCTDSSLMLVKKLIANPVIPTAKSHTVGVGAVVRDGNSILVIRERFMEGYKLPGGHIDPNEQISEAIRRELFEETGIEVVLESIANIGHFTEAQFGESNLYIVCTAKPLTKEIEIHDVEEILEARWMSIEEFISHESTNPYNKMIVQTVVDSTQLKLKPIELKLRVKSSYELYF